MADNGCGIPSQDIRLAFARRATNKSLVILDVMAMTPIDALNKLFLLKEKAMKL